MNLKNRKRSRKRSHPVPRGPMSRKREKRRKLKSLPLGILQQLPRN
jgi:hypothetical protein